MTTKLKFDENALMAKAIEVMKKSISEPREDNDIPPKVGAVMWKPDGTVDTAYRGEMRDGDHAEYTLLDRKNRQGALDGCKLFATLEPCGPEARNPPKLGCAVRIVKARIKEVWVGCQDPHPKVAGKGIQYLENNGVTVRLFPDNLQDEIEAENKEFFEQAQAKAEKEKQKQIYPSSTNERTYQDLGLHNLASDALSRYKSMLMDNRKITKITEDEFHSILCGQGLFEKAGSNLHPTGYGVLLFCESPSDYMLQAGIMGTLYKDGEVDDKKDFNGPMVMAPEQVIQWIKDKLPNPISRMEAQRKEKNGIYYELIREGLANALVHRDYDIEQANIQIEVTPEKTLIRSPGKPMKPVTLEKLQKFSASSFSRNPPLHAIFNIMGLAEKRGLGLRSMKNRAQQEGLPLPIYAWNDPYLDLTIYRAVEGTMESLGEEVSNKWSEVERRGWAYIASKGTITWPEYSKEMNVSRRTAQRHISNFVSLGLLRRHGSGRSVNYQVIQS